jgi:aryl-alcohol dehydrogenase-like predicted oxidoreductase
MLARRYGEHDVFLSVVGFGGICVTDESETEASRIVSTAVDRGINYFDVAPSYGNAEERLGPALEPYRRDVFLACKTNVRDADGAEREFRASQRKLRTDYIDLYQLHGIESPEEVDAVLAPGGALELLTRLQAAGEVRFLGFSAHNEDAALRLLDAYSFDSVLFPINWRAWYAGGVGPRLIDRARSRGAAVLALKALADRRLREGEARPYSKSWYKPVSTYAEAEMALRFTLSRPVTAAVSPGHEELLWWACDAAAGFSPLSVEEERELRDRALAADAADVPIFTRSVTRI